MRENNEGRVFFLWTVSWTLPIPVTHKMSVQIYFMISRKWLIHTKKPLNKAISEFCTKSGKEGGKGWWWQRSTIQSNKMLQVLNQWEWLFFLWSGKPKANKMLVRILVWFLLKDTFLFFLGHLAFVLLQSSLQMFIFFFGPGNQTGNQIIFLRGG